MVNLPRPTWNEFTATFRKLWKPGEHVFLSAQTGAGKTELLLKLMPLRTHGVIFCTKPGDPIFRTIEARDYRRIKTWADKKAYDQKLMLAPSEKGTPDEIRYGQTEEFRSTLDTIYQDKYWAVGIDEAAWLSESLHLGRNLADLHHIGRAYGVTLISATQRPKRLPVIIPQSASYAFVGKTMRKDDLATLAELGGETRETRAAIDSLRERHDFVFIDTLGRMPLQIVNTRA